MQYLRAIPFVGFFIFITALSEIHIASRDSPIVKVIAVAMQISSIYNAGANVLLVIFQSNKQITGIFLPKISVPSE